MRNKIWCYKNRGVDMAKINEFSKKYHLPPVISMVLSNRGITDEESVRSFLLKPLSGIYDPCLLNSMDTAVERIIKAIEEKEKIVVYGDYDVDGITSTVLLYSFLKAEGAEVEYYIPDRISEGYGINIMAINRIARGGAKLMITVDCGITAVGEVEFAITQRLDVIITDHHICKEELPRALAVINPKRTDSSYPFDALAGVGVAFKLVLALAKALGKSTKDTFMHYCELAAVGTVADVVPLLDENRIIVERGLSVMRGGGNTGIHALLKTAGAADKAITSSTIAFTIAPRINAAGRLGTAKTAVELLLEQDPVRADEIAAELDAANHSRQEAEQEIFEQAQSCAMNDPLFDKKQVIVIAGEGWHHGVIGIVASRICERFYKPCILISYENGVGKGSGRSIPGFNLFEALTAAQEHLTNFGGHAAAAGLGINMDEIDAFTAAINKYAAGVLTPEDMIQKVNIDCRVRPETVTLDCAHMIERLEPFGMDNEKPVFSLVGVMLAAVDTVGADGRHLRMKIMLGGRAVGAIGFGMGEYSAFFKPGDSVDIAFSMDINIYQGMQNLQLMLKDIKRHSSMQEVSKDGQQQGA